MFKKIIAGILMATTVLSTGVVSLAAEAPQPNDDGVYYYDGAFNYEIVDEDGNIEETGVFGLVEDEFLDAYNISAATVGVGKTVNWWPTSNTSGFKPGNNTAVSISLKTSAATSLTIGLTSGTKKDVTNKNPSVNLVCQTSGYTKMYVKNTSSKSIKVTGGTLSWNE